MTSTHRDTDTALPEADLGRMMAEILGRVDGTCGGKGGSMHIADISRGMLGADGIVEEEPYCSRCSTRGPIEK